MLGQRCGVQPSLIYEFLIEEHVPADHLLRSIDRFVDLDGIRAHLRPFDLLPKNWAVLSWNFPLMIPVTGEGEFHEEVKVHRCADRLCGRADIIERFDVVVKGWLDEISLVSDARISQKKPSSKLR